MNNIAVVYTMWGNLKKTPGMAVGQVGFHKQKEVCMQHMPNVGLYICGEVLTSHINSIIYKLAWKMHD